MKLSKEAELIAVSLFHNLANHDRVVNWVDEVIRNSDVTEEWMWELSLSKPGDAEENAYMLWRKFGWKELSFNEFLCLILYLHKQKDFPLYASCFSLSLEHDSYKKKNENESIIKLRSLVLDLESYLDRNEYSSASKNEVSERLEELLLELRLSKESQEIIDFLSRNA